MQEMAGSILRLKDLATMLAVCLLGACGGGGGGDEALPDGPGAVAPPPAAASAATPANVAAQPLITLTSDAGDSIGIGGRYAYDTGNAAIRVSVLGSYLNIRVEGLEDWTGDFRLPGNLGQLQPGTFTGLTRYPFQPNGDGGLAWSGQGRGCNELTGTLVVHSVDYQAGVLKAIDMEFEQHCEGHPAALRGRIRIDATTMARLMAPQNPLPEHPVIALRSDVGDYIGAGGVYAYDSSNAVIGIAADRAHLSVRVTGDQQWSADFQLPGGVTQLVPGTYTGLTRYPFQAAGAGALSWAGQGRGCNAVTGSIVIHSVRYDAGALSAIDMTFEQHCEGGSAALHGTIRWDASLPTAPAAPLSPPPDGLWTPPADALPPSGTAMYLSSEPGDFIGQGWTWWLGGAPSGGSGDFQGTAEVSVTESNGLLQVKLTGDVTWSGEFKAMDSLQQLQAGYYGILGRYPFHNPARGGMNWTMDSRGCNALSGWFVVDSISYLGDQLQSVDLRFTQYCDNAVAPLRGRIRWVRSGTGN